MKTNAYNADGIADSHATTRGNLASRVAWFVALWLAGILALSAAALIIRLAIHA